MKRPVAIWFLIIFFIWAVGKDIQLVVTHKISTDYAVFQHYEMLQIFYVFATVIFILDFLTSYFLVRPRKIGFWIALSSIVTSIVYSGLSLTLSIRDLQAVRTAYEIHREARGLIVRKELLDKIFTPEGMQATFAFSALVSVAACLIIVRNKRYF